jgi:hypothetical protein
VREGPDGYLGGSHTTGHLRGAGLVGFYSKVLEGVLFLVLGSSLLEACFSVFCFWIFSSWIFVLGPFILGRLVPDPRS